MQSRTLNKITREFFSKYPTVYVDDLSEQKNIIDDLRESIKESNNPNLKLDNSFSSYYRSKEIDKERTLYLEIRDPYKDRGWDNAGLVVSFKKDLDKNILSIKPAYGNQSYNFSGKPADLFDFVGVVLEKYIEIKNRKTKSAKVKKLKKSAIIARINEIARENRFNFHIREYSIKVQLAIQIGEKGIVTIDIPYSKFQEELGKIESIVTSSRELERSGIVANLNFNAQNTLRQFSFFTKYDAP